MRFLISEHPMYDLIIGARSIQEQNILDVPNLMVPTGVTFFTGEGTFTLVLSSREQYLTRIQVVKENAFGC